MPTYDDLFTSIENYKDMSIEALQYSKIGKGQAGCSAPFGISHTGIELTQAVMKKIAAMTTIPRNDEYKITDRAQKLMTGVS